ncbi:2'-5' RNA ligase family protein [Kineococcus sp. DHX-1]|uniref:2'-5' RNA ligase family protein n=1 Tax=Kineococcus sp. DHX-1 TaxID=3349638 RepID=UPI0036D28007
MEAAAQEQTALVVEVPAAEAAVAHWRRRHDRAARAGVPAHVTVCFPFLPPQALDDDVEDALTALAAATPASTLASSRVDGSGDAVLWLAPEPAEPLRALTRAVCAAFGLLPHGGAHGGVDDAVPHLTVAEDAPDPAAVRADLAPRLPVTQHVRELTLLQGTFAPDGWRVRRRFPLGQGTGTGPS